MLSSYKNAIRILSNEAQNSARPPRLGLVWLESPEAGLPWGLGRRVADEARQFIARRRRHRNRSSRSLNAA